mmetsp:Transcript_32955/g.80876  ORF Transcript_32955/g.80876 Transcript_32955/m.80876 type:complete len:251 (-) Transcript_32955:320-1072(-)
MHLQAFDSLTLVPQLDHVRQVALLPRTWMIRLVCNVHNLPIFHIMRHHQLVGCRIRSLPCHMHLLNIADRLVRRREMDLHPLRLEVLRRPPGLHLAIDQVPSLVSALLTPLSRCRYSLLVQSYIRKVRLVRLLVARVVLLLSHKLRHGCSCVDTQLVVHFVKVNGILEFSGKELRRDAMRLFPRLEGYDLWAAATTVHLLPVLAAVPILAPVDVAHVIVLVHVAPLRVHLHRLQVLLLEVDPVLRVVQEV